MSSSKDHKAGFVTIMGRPNVGKSTLMNALSGIKLAITSPRAQTTRHRIFGIISSENYQIVYSDTPGVITPNYLLQKRMMDFVRASLEDADIILYLVSLEDKNEHPEILKMAQDAGVPVLFLVNKIDLVKGTQLVDKLAYWKSEIGDVEMLPVSAISGEGVQKLLDRIIELLPAHPPYYPDESLTDRPERFFAAEIIREKIFLNYKQEIPYSTEVVITQFKEDENIIRIEAEIYVERESQKGILIGQKASSIKKVGIAARQEMEEFFQKKIHLETFVKVEKDWRKKESKLKKFGY